VSSRDQQRSGSQNATSAPSAPAVSLPTNRSVGANVNFAVSSQVGQFDIAVDTAPPAPHLATSKRRCGVRENAPVSRACSAAGWSGDSQRSWQHPSVSLTGGLWSTTLASTGRTGCPRVSRTFIRGEDREVIRLDSQDDEL
jgi:hypothetical protein